MLYSSAEKRNFFDKRVAAYCSTFSRPFIIKFKHLHDIYIFLSGIHALARG